jgi:hypothetical protein
MKLHELLEKLYALQRSKAGQYWYAEAHGDNTFYIGYTPDVRVGWVECDAEGTIKGFTPDRKAIYGDVEQVRSRLPK